VFLNDTAILLLMNPSTFGSIPFIQGVPKSRPEPLSRYLPPLNDDVVTTWLNRNSPRGSWILDPFGASPKIAMEAAHAGYRIIVTANNPITRFILEILANPPKSEELNAALAALAASYIGDQRLEPHIRSLYDTSCARCGQVISAEYFIWEHGNSSPSIRSYSCPNCGDTGEHPCTSKDIELSGRFSMSGPHKARALERVVAATDQDRIHVEQALSVYIPRALYALITIINKIEGLNISPIGQKNLSALLLYAFDQANAMWKPANQQERRRQLTIPRHFRENNIWLALEEGMKLWSRTDSTIDMPAIPISTWPQLPPSSGGICVYEGRFVSLAESLKDINISSVCTAIPRPNQAFWTLSALWAGWLWGRDAVGAYKSVLRRQRYDWAWHTTALSSVFKQLGTILALGTPIAGLIGEAEPGFIGAALVAAAMSGCHLESLAIRPESEQAQITWQVDKTNDLNQAGAQTAETAIESAKRYLELSGEPESYLNTISAALLGITRLSGSSSEVIPRVPAVSNSSPGIQVESIEPPEPTPSIIYTSNYNSARDALSYRSGFLRYSLQDAAYVDPIDKNLMTQSSLFSYESEKKADEEADSEITETSAVNSGSNIERERPTRSSDISLSALLWLRDTERVNQIPISDRYELTLVSYLAEHPVSSLQAIDLIMCETYPGLFTPPLDFIHLCLESYAIQNQTDTNQWHLRPEDDPRQRQSDLDFAGHSICQIGERIGYTCVDRNENVSTADITWLNNNGEADYCFFLSSSAAIGKTVVRREQPAVCSFIVLPGSRANLLVYKLRRDLRLARAFNPSQGNWRFLKFRHLRSMAGSPNLNRDNLDQLLNLDPITFTTPQLWLI
jgi:hypothetical protein